MAGKQGQRQSLGQRPVSKEMTKESPKLLPLSRSLLYIFVSVLLVSGSCLMALLYYQHVRGKRRHDPAYTISALVQTTAGSEGLKTVYLAELLDLSVDHPKNLYAFSSAEAQQKLLRSPLIKQVQVRKIRPGTIHVDYLMRKPLAYLADLSNTAIDREGFLFPFKPFFTPKKLPQIFLGTLNRQNTAWGEKLTDDKLNTAFELLELANRFCCDSSSSLVSIDLSQSDAPSSGRAQIVVAFQEEGGRSHIVRLTPAHYHQELANYQELRRYLRSEPKYNQPNPSKTVVIDLRLADLAFISMD